MTNQRVEKKSRFVIILPAVNTHYLVIDELGKRHLATSKLLCSHKTSVSCTSKVLFKKCFLFIRNVVYFLAKVFYLLKSSLFAVFLCISHSALLLARFLSVCKVFYLFVVLLSLNLSF